MHKRMSAVKKIVLKKFPDAYCKNLNGKRGDNLFILRFGKNSSKKIIRHNSTKCWKSALEWLNGKDIKTSLIGDYK